jgi:5-methylcytosine-specific restriction protein A
VHHLVKISSSGAEHEVDPVTDLRPVCPNCHAMLHRKDPPYTLEEIATNLKK